MNSELVRESVCKPYQPRLDYDENTIGCGVLLEYVSKEGYEKVKNCFCGQMGALYFIEVSAESLSSTHSVLSRASERMGFEDLVHKVSGIKTSGKADLAGVVEKIFMQVNPKYTGKISQSKQRLYVVYPKSKGKDGLDVCNHVESLYKEVRIDHNLPAKDVFLNIGGAKVLMPLLYQLGESLSEVEQHDFAYLNLSLSSVGIGMRSRQR